MPHAPIPKLSEKFVERFLDSYIKVDGCWDWIGWPFTNNGYGTVKVGTRNFTASRIMYYLAFGSDPGRLCVLHRCDNPRCVKPAHLFLGTQADNSADKIAKGRNTRQGTRATVAMIKAISPTERAEILRLVGRYSVEYVAKKMALSCAVVRAIGSK